MDTKKLGYIIFFIIILLVIAGVALRIGRPPTQDTPNPTSTSTTSSTSSETSNMMAEPNGLIMLDQRPSNTVSVSMAIFDTPGPGGYVVIHEATSTMGLGDVVGISDYLTPGEHSEVSIQLSRAAYDGQKYTAVLHTDNGDKKFDPAVDKPLMSEVLTGEIIMADFMIDRNAESVGSVTL